MTSLREALLRRRHHFKQDLDDLRFYDLAFNTDYTSVEMVVNSILAAMDLSRTYDAGVSKLRVVPKIEHG